MHTLNVLHPVVEWCSRHVCTRPRRQPWTVNRGAGPHSSPTTSAATDLTRCITGAQRTQEGQLLLRRRQRRMRSRA